MLLRSYCHFGIVEILSVLSYWSVKPVVSEVVVSEMGFTQLVNCDVEFLLASTLLYAYLVILLPKRPVWPR